MLELRIKELLIKKFESIITRFSGWKCVLREILVHGTQKFYTMHMNKTSNYLAGILQTRTEQVIVQYYKRSNT